MESLITVSTVNNINYAFSDEESQRNKAMDKLTGRRSRKALKGGEKRWVWPPELEAAFLEGLKRYRPKNCRAYKSLNRMSGRNKEISNYIYLATGERRTPKQVGSRIQQLQGSAKRGTELYDLLHSTPLESGDSQVMLSSPHSSFVSLERSVTPRRAFSEVPTTPSSCRSTFTSSTSSDWEAMPTTPVSTGASDLPLSTTFVTVDIESPGQFSLFPAVDHVDWHQTEQTVDHVDRDIYTGRVNHRHYRPRPFDAIDPNVAFYSPSKINMDLYRSRYIVMHDGSQIHSEVTALSLLPDTAGGLESSCRDTCSYLYGTEFLPKYWKKLCESTDLSRISVIQTISRHDSSLTPALDDEFPLLYVVYYFRHRMTDQCRKEIHLGAEVAQPVMPNLPPDMSEPMLPRPLSFNEPELYDPLLDPMFFSDPDGLKTSQDTGVNYGLTLSGLYPGFGIDESFLAFADYSVNN